MGDIWKFVNISTRYLNAISENEMKKKERTRTKAITKNSKLYHIIFFFLQLQIINCLGLTKFIEIISGQT